MTCHANTDICEYRRLENWPCDLKPPLFPNLRKYISSIAVKLCEGNSVCKRHKAETCLEKDSPRDFFQCSIRPHVEGKGEVVKNVKLRSERW